MKNLVIGNGQIGKAIAAVLECDIVDVVEFSEDTYNVIHVCFPHSSLFDREIEKYMKIYEPKLIVIHSTVPVGTTRKFGSIAVHSPIRGIHPNLEEGVRTFDKMFGGINPGKVDEAITIFEEAGVRCAAYEKPEITEAGKLLSTTYYGWNIIFEKYVHEYCEKNDLDYDAVYRDFNLTYNIGYKEMGKPNVVRPVLEHYPGKIGGHCVIANTQLLEDFTPANIIYEKDNEILSE